MYYTMLQTNRIADQVAKTMSIADNASYEVQDFEDMSFELSLNGEEFAGGSYFINKYGQVILASVTPQKVIGTVKDGEFISMEQIRMS